MADGCGCSGGRRRHNVGNVTQIKMIKIRYLGDLEEPTVFKGVATKTPYQFCVKINLGEVDVRDLSIGRSTHPGLFELRGPKGERLFRKHVPLKEELGAEARAQEAREAAEAFALTPEEPVKRRKVKAKVEEPDDETPK